jgi:hypothetical protein
MEQPSRIHEAVTKNGSVYISVTGLKIKGPLAFFSFWRHAIPSKIQADRAPGMLFLSMKEVSGYHHTLSVWENKQAMLDYRSRGAHQLAMKMFRKIASEKVVGYESDHIPDWDEALQVWDDRGRIV